MSRGDDEMALEERACGRAGLDGGMERGLCEPSLSLLWLLGGVGGRCTSAGGQERKVKSQLPDYTPQS